VKSHWIVIASVAALAGLAAGAGFAQQGAAAAPPPGEGLDLIQRACINCHDIYMIIGKRKTAEEWATTVGTMADRGAEITPDEMRIIEDYLARNFSVDSAPQAQQQTAGH
jgi:hypothetical protein